MRKKTIKKQKSDLAEIEAYGQLVQCFNNMTVEQIPELGGKGGLTSDFKIGDDLFVEVYCPDKAKSHKEAISKLGQQGTAGVSTVISHPVTGNEKLAVSYPTNQTIARAVSGKREKDQTRHNKKNILWVNLANKLGLKVKDCLAISSVNHSDQTYIGCFGIWHSFYGQKGQSTFPKERFNIRFDGLDSDWYKQRDHDGLFRERKALSAAIISCADGIVLFQNPFSEVALEKDDLTSLFKLYQFRPEYSWFDLSADDLKKRVDMCGKNIELLKVSET